MTEHTESVTADRLLWALTVEPCAWCGDVAWKHNGHEMRQCLYALLMTKEGLLIDGYDD